MDAFLSILLRFSFLFIILFRIYVGIKNKLEDSSNKSDILLKEKERIEKGDIISPEYIEKNSLDNDLNKDNTLNIEKRILNNQPEIDDEIQNYDNKTDFEPENNEKKKIYKQKEYIKILNISKKDVLKGIVFKEILDEPRARKPFRFNYK
jgi:hypothetical protein